MQACGVDHFVGTCVPVPITCPTTDSPVCSCSFITYANDCLRIAARDRRRAQNGPCP
jgi:hypothetical protein